MIIGGGLAGLISGFRLAKAGIPCVLIEKKSYPLHRVCGEYISNEAVPFLRSIGLYPEELGPSLINLFQLSSVTGRQAQIPLDSGGFGVSRFSFDHFLFQKARDAGVEFMLNEEVTDVQFAHEQFTIQTKTKTIQADLVLGAFGKRSKLDIKLGRDFTKKRSPYVGVKYHIRTDHPGNLIALHNFSGGYCGISNVENGISNLCYLAHRETLRFFGDVPSMETNVLYQNPLLKSIFLNSEFLFEKPEVINEISFETKSPVCDHMLMVGDAAGMITPLCGNGMAMAMHAAKIASALAVDFSLEKKSRLQVEQMYHAEWKKLFALRLWKGRQIQRLFGNRFISNAAVNLALYVRPVANMLVRNTHGPIF